MEKQRIFALGTYTALGGPGIRVFQLREGKMETLYDCWIEDPIWLHLSRDQKHLYAACGGEGPSEGFVASFAPAEGDFRKGLKLEAKRPAHGVCPCYATECGGDLITANYLDGSLSVFPLENGLPGELCQLIRHEAKEPGEGRQESPHVHQALPMGDNAFLAVDLGLDQLAVYEKEKNAWKKTAEIPVHPGDGPRHALMQGDFVYLATELSSMLRVFHREGNHFREAQSFPLPEPGYPGVNYPAAIRMSPDGNTLMISCRGADAVAFFRVSRDGALTFDGWAGVHGCWPRDIWPMDGETLLCANQNSGDVTLLRRAGKYLEALDAMRLPGPVCILPLPLGE